MKKDNTPKTTSDSDLALIEASVADFVVLSYGLVALLQSGESRTRLESEVHMVGWRSGTLWAAVGRIIVAHVYIALERIVGWFARDQVVDVTLLLEWLEREQQGNEPELRSRLPGFEKELRRREVAGMTGRDVNEQLELALIEALTREGYTPAPSLVKQVVALKILRNQAAHTSLKVDSAAEAYLKTAGFPASITRLERHHAILALETLTQVIDMFSMNYVIYNALARSNGGHSRLDILSDLPIYLKTIADRLRIVE